MIAGENGIPERLKTRRIAGYQATRFAVLGGESRGAGLVSRAGPNICVKLTAAPVGLARLEVGWAQPQLTPGR